MSNPWFDRKVLSGNESPRNRQNKTAYAEPKFVPSGTPIAVSLTLKKYVDEGVGIKGGQVC